MEVLHAPYLSVSHFTETSCSYSKSKQNYPILERKLCIGRAVLVGVRFTDLFWDCRHIVAPEFLELADEPGKAVFVFVCL